MMIMTKKKRQEMEAQRLKAEAERLQMEEELRHEKEIERRMIIKRSLNSMKNSIGKLASMKQKLIEKARNAALNGDKQASKIAKARLKHCLNKEKFLTTMVENFEFSLELADTNKSVEEFIKGVNVISEQMNMLVPTIDINKAQAAYEKALANNENQLEAMDAFLESASNSLESISGGDDLVTDEEIDRLIFNQAVDAEDSLDKEIDSKITAIKEKVVA